MSFLATVLAAAIGLSGVIGDGLVTRAYFDVNNVKVGDPLILTIDFMGNADFASLHPPALSRHVDRKDWKVDDASAKTETDTRRIGGFFSSQQVAVSRSLVYRVRPMREGVLWFPALAFEYTGPDGKTRTAVANEIPVHAKAVEQVVVAELDPVADTLPEPPALVLEPDVRLTDDEAFAWRKACANPTADAFREFSFPAGRMNEARCAILEGQWRRALKIYSRLEWSVGQTPDLERGIVAAQAVRFDNAAAELPVWRQVLRPLLRHDARGRLGILGGGLAAVLLVFWLLGRAIKALACVGLVFLFALPASAQGIFEEMEKMMEAQRRQMEQMSSSMSLSFGGREQKPPEVKASVRTEPAELQVGQPFEFVLALEAPKTCSIGQVQMTPSEMYGLSVVGPTQNMTDGVSANPSNVVRRLAIPVRYDVPFTGKLSFAIDGMISGRQESGTAGRSYSFTFSTSFRTETPAIDVDIRPLPSAGQPADFSGIIAENLSLLERLDLNRVETNDVIQITYHLEYAGYLPRGWKPEGVAFEVGRGSGNGRNAVEWRRYFVADGAAETPRLKVISYDPKKKEYRHAEAGGTQIQYR
jgi:hypothetical protein